MGPIKMNCRLSSDTQPLETILHAAGVASKISHVAGRPMATSGPLAGRLATRHYATISYEDGFDNADVSRWLDATIAVLNTHHVLRDGIHEGAVNAILWIAVMVRPAPPDIVIEPGLVEAAAKLGAQILLEDYNKDSDGGNSHKLFLP